MRPLALALLCATIVSTTAPSVVVAQNPFGGGGGLQTAPADEPQAPGPPPGDGLGTWQTLVILLGGAVLVGGIAWAIMRDARGRSAAQSDGHEDGRERARVEREAEHRRRKAGARKKGKAAKKARRSNRPR